MQSGERLTLSITETAAALGVSRPMVYRLIQSGGFPVLNIGSRRLVPKKALEDWIEARMGKGGAV